MNKFNILTENDRQISQPKFIDIELMIHQKTMIHKMMELEEKGLIDVSNISFRSRNLITGKIKSAQIQTNFGVLADKVGAGKTLKR